MPVQSVQDQDKLQKVSRVPGIVEAITGDRPHICTIHRWIRKGCKGVKLQTAFCGGHRRTSERWVQEFFDAVTQAADGTREDHVSKPATSGLEAAERELSAAGI
jgi:hypothetical protein